MPLLGVIGVLALIFLVVGTNWLDDRLGKTRCFFRKALKLDPPEVYGPPTPVRPKNPYKADGPLANAWDRGFWNKMHGWRSQGRSVAYWQGEEAALAYIRSGLARWDLKQGRLRLGLV